MSWLSLGATLLGGMMQSNSASSAANTQAESTRAATAENARQYDRNVQIEQQRYDQNRSDRQPYMATGRTALAQYLREMGLPGVTSGRSGSMAAAPGGAQSRDQLLNQLRGQYTTTTQGGSNWDAYPNGVANEMGVPQVFTKGASTVDEQGLNAAVDRMFSQQQGGQGGYGDLPAMEDIQTTEPQPIEMDPGYEFGKQQGQQALDRQFAKQGGRVSGAAMKTAAEYGTNYATTGYSAAYGRRQDRLIRLQALAGYGSTPASGSTGQQPNNGNAALISSQGNAAGAAQLAQGNIWGNTINQGVAQWGQQGNSNRPTSPFQNYQGDYNSLGYQP